MKRVDELFIEKANRILALGFLGRIALEAFKSAMESPDGEFHRLFTEMSSKLAQHYLAGRPIQVPQYKVVSFIDSQSLIAMISEAEAFFQDVMVEVLCLHPEKIGNSMIEVSRLSELGTIEAAIRSAAEKRVRDVMFRSPQEYKRQLLSVISAPDELVANVWPTYVEAKARRDLGVHNSWKVNDTYRAKIKDVGMAEPAETELSVEIYYFLRVREATVELMDRVRKHCQTKFD